MNPAPLTIDLPPGELSDDALDALAELLVDVALGKQAQESNHFQPAGEKQ